MEIFV
ncbi:hypothetical protein CJF30_00011158 [Rutstroemia sp. NJR-2017a BBW]